MSIGSYAFYNCTAIEEITIPDSVIQIGKGVFEKCSLKRVFMSETKYNILSKNVPYDLKAIFGDAEIIKSRIAELSPATRVTVPKCGEVIELRNI